MKNIIVVGGGGHARVVISLIKKLGRYKLVGFTDPEPSAELLDVPYLGDDGELEAVLRDHARCSAALGIGNTSISDRRVKKAVQLVEMGFDLPALISPSAVVNEDVSLGDGTVVLDGAIVVTGTRIGSSCILNTGCMVDHDCRVGDGVHLAPGSVLSGGVDVGKSAMIGAGAVVIHNRKVSDCSLVGAGATVTTDLTETGVYVGTPARRLE